MKVGWPKIGDVVELMAVPSGLHPDAAKQLIAGMVGTVTDRHNDCTCDVEFPSGILVLENRLLRRSSTGATVDKIIPGSTAQCTNIQNLNIEVLGEGRTINVSAGQVIDWFDEKSKHAPLSDVSRIMGIRLRQAIRKLVDAEKLLEFVPKDEPDHAHLRYIEVSSRITNCVLSIVGDIENTASDAMF